MKCIEIFTSSNLEKEFKKQYRYAVYVLQSLTDPDVIRYGSAGSRLGQSGSLKSRLSKHLNKKFARVPDSQKASERYGPYKVLWICATIDASPNSPGLSAAADLMERVIQISLTKYKRGSLPCNKSASCLLVGESNLELILKDLNDLSRQLDTVVDTVQMLFSNDLLKT
ncbi:hypothetical protein AA0242T_1893 [Acetobacter aceti NRIC 0242]|uniref:GIY-YIG domain-containing protein n=1 Tax=Acetobacter aceti NBRC 14818 TaxID=887700 RepID=A0AB33IES9_ACEAC|nr:hypothetical protein [Acetobacter aceti]TCS35296.1 hypothetical protein EDC15_10193 [Acetobacter aceti NBRC 14818]BCK75316.1 hypothetical protein EMQ_0922 [Acetobacter aceti NBRC 14818]GAN57394.1 hypothetical protein Abac_017_095 [Acetobacter aceti NBRC 14818]GBO81191.1 hypothetical protein AA0242T_1893 [Acetobacter aceti NRIC 0242]